MDGNEPFPRIHHGRVEKSTLIICPPGALIMTEDATSYGRCTYYSETNKNRTTWSSYPSCKIRGQLTIVGVDIRSYDETQDGTSFWRYLSFSLLTPATDTTLQSARRIITRLWWWWWWNKVCFVDIRNMPGRIAPDDELYHVIKSAFIHYKLRKVVIMRYSVRSDFDTYWVCRQKCKSKTR